MRCRAPWAACLGIALACGTTYGESTGPGDVPVDAAPPDAGADGGGPAGCSGGDTRAPDPSTGHCYVLFRELLSWSDARQACTRLGMHLVTVTSQAENKLVGNLGGDLQVWIGASDLVTEGTFEWVTGESFGGYTSWRTGEPDPATRETEDCLEIRPGAEWNDTRCTGVRAYVCERD